MASLFEEIGYWSEIKLDIVREYASAYSSILTKKFYHVYIDAFSGSGKHISKTTGDFVLGSPANALKVKPPFKEYYFIDIDKDKTDELQKLRAYRNDIHIYEGDCNTILLDKIFPNIKYDDYQRGLCLLDPYGLDLNWEVTATAGNMRCMDIFLNFPIQDMNRNVLWNNAQKVNPAQADRLTKFWGNETWKTASYKNMPNLFGYDWPIKVSGQEIAKAFQERLRKVAGFKYVPNPIPMRNSKGSVVYYLFFASQKPVAGNIVNDIFDKYRNWGEQ